MRDSLFYTYPASHGLLDSFATYLIKENTSDSHGLSDKVILLPTRRCIRLLREIFRKKVSSSLMMPHFFALGDLAYQALPFIEALGILLPPAKRELLCSLPLPIDPIRSHLLISSWLTETFDSYDTSPSSTLISLLRETYTTLSEYGLDLSHIEAHIPEHHSLHWTEAATLLKAFWTFWPQCLEEDKRSDPGVYKKTQLEIIADLLSSEGSSATVFIIAPKGLSISLKHLLKNLVQKIPTLLLLEGDQDDYTPRNLEARKASPYGEQLSFLTELPFPVSSFTALPENIPYTSAPLKTNYAFKKKLTSSCFSNPSPSIEPSEPMNSLTFFEGETLAHEAQFIALKLRKVLSTPGKTASLITPDRLLAQRVTQELLYFGIIPDDSLGLPMSQTPFGQLITLSFDTLVNDFSQGHLHALLRHPLCQLENMFPEFSKARDLLEAHFLRGIRCIPGFSTLKERISEKNTLPRDDQNLLLAFIAHLETAFLPLTLLLKNPSVSFFNLSEVFQAHSHVLIHLMGENPLFPLEELAPLFPFSLTPFQKHLDRLPLLPLSSYQDGLQSYLTTTTLPSRPTHKEISILGILESRLASPDFVILGGLTETHWDAALTPNPWLNETLRDALDLETNATVYNQIFQEFLSHLCHPEVCLTRSRKTLTSIQKPSRFFLKAKTRLNPADSLPLDADASFVEKLHGHRILLASQPPSPSPPLSFRPTTLSVTDLATLMQNPYGHYVRKILRLTPLHRFAEEASSQDIGIWVHKLLEESLKQNAPPLRDLFETYIKSSPFTHFFPSKRLFLLKRMEALLDGFAKTEQERNRLSLRVSAYPEVPVEWTSAPEPHDTRDAITLKGRIDRLEISSPSVEDFDSSSHYHLIDYKTGFLPPHKDISSSQAPQMALLGILLEKKFPTASATSIEASFWSLRPGTSSLVSLLDFTTARQNTLSQLLILLEQYYGTSLSSYNARPRAYDPFPGLSRQQEWSGLLSHFFQDTSDEYI